MKHTCQHTRWKNNKTVKENWKQVWKNKKVAGETRIIFFGFQRRFLEIFFALQATTHGLRSNSKENKNPVFITFFGLKDCVGFKGRREMSVRWYRSRFLQSLVVIFPRKSTQVKIHTKMAIFWLVFSAKNPVKSDKLALIEGKILNLMFFDVNIPVVPSEIWLRLTHNQREKNSQSRFSLIISPYFKDQIVARMRL